jgi:hypothetical protein
LAILSRELSGGSDFDGTTSGCDAVDVGSCSHFDRRLVGTCSTLDGTLGEHRHTERQHITVTRRRSASTHIAISSGSLGDFGDGDAAIRIRRAESAAGRGIDAFAPLQRAQERRAHG